MTYNIDIDDYIGQWGVSKQFVKQELLSLKGKPVAVRISSLGGSLDHGLNIRQQFIDHGDVSAYLYGYVASAATISSLGAKRVYMSKYAFYLVHKVSNWVDEWGQMNADQIQQLIEKLIQNKEENDKMDLVAAQLYAAKCGKEIPDIIEVLKKGTWITAQEALEYGFIDEIIEEGEKMNFNDSMREKFNYLGLPSLPSIPSAPQPDSQGIIDVIRAGFNDLKQRFPFGKGDHFNSTDGLPPSKNQTNEKMDIKNYTHLSEALKVENLDASGGKVMLTADQLNALDRFIQGLQNSVTGKNTEIENLKKKPGASTGKVNEGEDSNETSNVFAEAIDLYNKV